MSRRQARDRGKTFRCALLRSVGPLALVLALAPGALAAERPPNIVVFLADDLGWGSVGAYGADPVLVRTPNIDRIAAEGVLFRDASAPSSVCTPTRYALLTGRYAWRTSLKVGTLGYKSPLLLDEAHPTLATLLAESGYSTAIIGKWHLGLGDRPKADYLRPLRPGPLERGFDHFFGLSSNHGDRTGVYIDDHSVAGLRSKTLLPAPRRGENFKGQAYIGLDAPHRVDEEVMDVLTARATDWLADQDSTRPFFLLFSAVAVHRPISPSAGWQGSSAAGSYGDWIHELDGSVGAILRALDDLGLADDTLVLFTSDNGGVVERNEKLAATQAAAKGLKINGPYRGGKRSVFEGGFRVPLVARWPGRIPQREVRGEMVGLVDLYATLAGVAGIRPEDLPGSGDSVSFLDALLGGERQGPVRGSMITHAGDGNFAIRWGPWKWIEGRPHAKRNKSVYPELPQQHHPQLYDLTRDPGEERNLVDDYPEVARLMSRLLQRHRESGETDRVLRD